MVISKEDGEALQSGDDGGEVDLDDAGDERGCCDVELFGDEESSPFLCRRRRLLGFSCKAL